MDYFLEEKNQFVDAWMEKSIFSMHRASIILRSTHPLWISEHSAYVQYYPVNKNQPRYLRYSDDNAEAYGSGGLSLNPKYD